MIEKIYPLSTYPTNNIFTFVSSGPKGDFTKVVIFSRLKPNVYQLVFGNLTSTLEINDSIVSNNEDWRKVIETVAFCIVEFTGYFSNATVEFVAVDKRRAILYNYVFQKKQQEIEALFSVSGEYEGKDEKYNPKHFYQSFSIQRKSIKNQSS